MLSETFRLPQLPSLPKGKESAARRKRRMLGLPGRQQGAYRQESSTGQSGGREGHVLVAMPWLEDGERSCLFSAGDLIIDMVGLAIMYVLDGHVRLYFCPCAGKVNLPRSLFLLSWALANGDPLESADMSRQN